MMNEHLEICGFKEATDSTNIDCGNMRALHIGKFYPPFAGGMENFLGDLLPALGELGVETGVIAHDHSFKHKKSCPVAREDTNNIWRVPCWGELLYTPISPRFPFWLSRIIKQYKPDILHLHLPNVSAFWPMLLPCARRLPWVIHWHSDVVASQIDRRLLFAYRFYKPFEQKLLSLSKTIIATSPSYLASSKALAPWREKCVTVPLGLDPGRLPLPNADHIVHAQKNWQTKKFKLLAIGRLTYYKGHESLIQAVAKLENAKTLIVGDGDRARQLQKLIVSLGAQNKVVLTGALPQDELNALLATCDCFCLPSLERTEAFGLVLLEAMRFGKPIVATDIPGSGVGFVVQDGKTGLLVPVDDSDMLCQALQKLALDTSQAERFGKAGMARFDKHFHITNVARQVKEIYIEVCNNLV